MADRYDIEGVEHSSRPTNAGETSHFRGARSHRLQVFGWYSNSMAAKPMQRITITRAFHGPRRRGGI